MQISDLTKRLFDLVRYDKKRITNEGQILVGDSSFTLSEFRNFFLNEELEIKHRFITNQTIISAQVKDQIISELRFILSEIQESLFHLVPTVPRSNEIIFDTVTNLKSKLCEEMISMLSEPVPTESVKSSETKTMSESKLNFNLSQRELTMLFHSLKTCGILNNEEIDVKKSLVSGCTYLDDEHYANMQLNSLANEFARAKNGTDINRRKTCKNIIGKLEKVITHLNSIVTQEDLAYGHHISKNKSNSQPKKQVIDTL